MKKITNWDLSIFLIYIFQAFLYILFLNKSIYFTNYNFFFYLLISIFLGIGIILLFSYLFNLSNNNIFGNIKNKFLVFIFLFFPFIFSIFCLSNIADYINYIYLKDIDIFIIILSFIIIIFFLIKNDIITFFRCSTLMFYMYLFLEIITFILLCFYINITDILPITYDLENILDYSYLYLCFLIMPILFLLVVPKNLVNDNKNTSRKIYIIYIIISIIIFLKSVLSISILSYFNLSIYNYPDVIIYKNINLFSFIENMEWLLCFNSITNMFFMISLCLIYIKEGINYIYPIKKKSYLYPLLICVMVLILSYFININYIFVAWMMIIYFLIHLTLALFKLLK